MRPLSPKGYSELIFKDAAASIRRTAQEFQYQIVIQRAYEEGEEELLAEDGDDEAIDGALAAEKDEKIFLLDAGLHFRSEVRDGGEKVLAWRDLSGDPGDLFEFVCDRSVQAAAVGSFEMVAIQCQYERTYRKSHEHATEKELHQFSFSDQPVAGASEGLSARPRLASPEAAAPSTRSTPAKDGPTADATSSRAKTPAGALVKHDTPTAAPPVATHPASRETLATEKAELHLFDFNSGSFILQDADVTATVSEVGGWQYWLQIAGKDKDWLGQAVIADINPVFNFEYLSFIFNHYTADGSAYSWLLRFRDQETEERFQEGLMQALWEQLNETKWTKAKDNDREYVLEAFQDLTMEDADAREEQHEDAEEEEEDEAQDDGQAQRALRQRRVRGRRGDARRRWQRQLAAGRRLQARPLLRRARLQDWRLQAHGQQQPRVLDQHQQGRDAQGQAVQPEEGHAARRGLEHDPAERGRPELAVQDGPGVRQGGGGVEGAR